MVFGNVLIIYNNNNDEYFTNTYKLGVSFIIQQAINSNIGNK